MTLKDLMDCPQGAEQLAETATHEVFAAGRALPPECHQAFLVGVVQAATWCLRRTSGDAVAHAALTAALNTLSTPIQAGQTIQ